MTPAWPLAPTTRRALRRGLGPLLVVFGLACPALGAVKPGLAGAQDLFRRNHWQEARAHLRGQWSAVAESERAAATFLIGRSHVREAEFYRAVRQVGVEIGLAYYKELAGQRSNRRVALLPLFTAFYQLEAGEAGTAARGLSAAAALPALSPAWKASARLRHVHALAAVGRAPAAAATEPGVEERFWQLLARGTADASPTNPTTPRERLLAAAIQFRGGRGAAAEQLLAGLDLDSPDAEDRSDPKKVLRFHDPLVAAAWERVCWERAVIALRPQAIAGGGVEQTLAAYYTGLSLFELGAHDESARFLKQASASASPLPAPLQSSAQILLAACSWPGRVPTAAELLPLWDATRGQPDSVLTWHKVVRADLARSEPFATKLDLRTRELLHAPPERPSGAFVGAWALARLRRGADATWLLPTLAEYRDDSNKNKVDWNDPLLLLALAAANHRNQQYAQSLETLFELSKSFPGLRWVQWNLQGVYAARQKAGGETRISQ